MLDNIEPAFVNIELNEYLIVGADEVGVTAGDAQTIEEALNGDGQDEDGQSAGPTTLEDGVGEDGQSAAAMAVDNGEDEDGQSAAPMTVDEDEDGQSTGNVVHAYPQPGGGMDYFLFVNLLLMVASIVISFLSDPAYNARLAANKLSGLFINMPPRAFRAVNWSFIGLGIATFVVHALRGEWSRLDIFRQKCLRLICLGLGVTALFLKWIEPKHINLSYAPGVITLAVEITDLCIDVIAAAAIFFFDTAFPWMATTGKPLISFLGALAMVIVVWALYRG